MIIEWFTKRERFRKTARLLAHENNGFNDDVLWNEEKCNKVTRFKLAKSAKIWNHCIISFCISNNGREKQNPCNKDDSNVTMYSPSFNLLEKSKWSRLQWSRERPGTFSSGVRSGTFIARDSETRLFWWCRLSEQPANNFVAIACHLFSTFSFRG